MAVRNDLLVAPERPLRVAAPPRRPAPAPVVPWWSGRPAPHDRPDRPEGVDRWRTDLVVAVPTSRRRRRGLVLLRPLAALPVLALLVAVRVAVLVALPVAWGCRVVANDLPQPLARAYAWTLRLVNRLRAWLWLTAEDPGDVALSLRRRPPHRRRRAWSWLLLAPFQLFLRYFAAVLVAVLVPLGWIASLVTGREPGAMQRVLSPMLVWLARGDAYLLLLSDHRPRLPEIAPRPPSGAPNAIWPRLPPWPPWVAPASIGIGIGLSIASSFAVLGAAAATDTSLTNPDSAFDLAAGAVTSLTILASALATARLTGRLRPWQFGLARLQVGRSLGWMAIALAGFLLAFAAVLAPFVIVGATSLDDGDAVGYRLSSGGLPGRRQRAGGRGVHGARHSGAGADLRGDLLPRRDVRRAAAVEGRVGGGDDHGDRVQRRPPRVLAGDLRRPPDRRLRVVPDLRADRPAVAGDDGPRRQQRGGHRSPARLGLADPAARGRVRRDGDARGRALRAAPGPRAQAGDGDRLS